MLPQYHAGLTLARKNIAFCSFPPLADALCIELIQCTFCWFAVFFMHFPSSPSFLKLFLILITSVQFSSVSDYSHLHLFSLSPLAAILLPWAAFPMFLSPCLLASPVNSGCCHRAAAQLLLQRLLVIMWILVSPGEKGCIVLWVRLNPDQINQAPFCFLSEINLFCCSLQQN